MYNINELVSIVEDAMEAQTEENRYNRAVRTKKGLDKSACLWIPSLDGLTAYSLGELYEKSHQKWVMLASICRMLDIDQTRLVGTVKSMRRKDKRNWRWSNGWLGLTYGISEKDQKRLIRFLANSDL